VVGGLGASEWWIAVPLLAVTLARVVVAIATQLRKARALRERLRREPDDQWIVELDAEDVGRLTAAQVTDMFWKNFLVVGDDARLFDEQLWLSCRFRFRHAHSGRHALHAFCGGLRPTVDAPWVTMRGLY